MTPVNSEGFHSPEIRESRWQELALLSDEALLEFVVAREDGGEVDFPSPYRGRSARGGGRHYLSSETVMSSPCVDDFLLRGAGQAWRVAFDAYREVATDDWEETWENCRTAALTSLLKDLDVAFCTARVAWHRRDAQDLRAARLTVRRQLQAISSEARREALEAFGRDGAISAAYEGIGIDPKTLAQ